MEKLFGGGIWNRYLEEVLFEKIGWTRAIRIKFKITLHFEILDRLEP